MSKKDKLRQRVFVAMSGGVDSSVSAALLKKEGFEVVGVYMKCWTANDPLYKGCTSGDDERCARLAASHLDIPFYSWNFIKEYRERVVEYMLKGYKDGITPNPDMMCNKEIKFGFFYEKAMKLGADFIATGHYARLRNTKVHSLLMAKDKNKDQSYFLSFIKPKVLAKVFFPIGEYTKPEVRTLARKFGLPNAERKESQGICFIGKLNFEDFLKKHIASFPGEIQDTKGNVLGTHEGLALYTIGQRKRIRLSGGPYYVVAKNRRRNVLVVSKDEKHLLQKSALVENVHWLRQSDANVFKAGIKVRYRAPSALATVAKIQNTRYKIQFEEPQRAITPGQFAVFYTGEELIGGGVLV